MPIISNSLVNDSQRAHKLTDACRSQTAGMQSTQHVVSSLQQERVYKTDIIRYNAEHVQTSWTLDALLLRLLGVGTFHWWSLINLECSSIITEVRLNDNAAPLTTCSIRHYLMALSSATALTEWKLHRVSKNFPPSVCYNFDTCEQMRFWYFFGRNVTDKVSYWKDALLCHLKWRVLLHYLVKRGNTKIAFSLKCCINALPEFNLSDSWLVLTLLYDCLNLVINAFSSGLLEGMVQEKGSRERRSSWTVLHAQCTSVLCSGFPLSQGNTEAVDRWGRQRKYRLISYFLSNTSAKNYRNRIMYVKIIASKRWDVFETQCTRVATNISKHWKTVNYIISMQSSWRWPLWHTSISVGSLSSQLLDYGNDKQNKQYILC